MNRMSREQLAPEPLIIGPGGLEQNGNLVVISKDNYYNPFGTDIGLASRRLDEFGNRIHVRDIHTFRIVAGFDGTLADTLGPLSGWSWDASVNYGRTFGNETFEGNLQTSRVAAALGRSRLEGGVPVCVNENDEVIPGCVPLDLFHGAGSITQAQVAPLAYKGTQKGYNQLTAVQANTSGDLFKLWSERPVGLALGYEYRYVAGGLVNDPLKAHFDTSDGGSFDTGGHYSVDEGYGELSIPLVSNIVGAQELELDIAGRIFKYSNFGSDSTYKLGARWSPIKDVTLRGTYSTAFRAPSINDLFAGQFDNFPNVSDPCANSASAQCVAEGAANNGDDSSQLRSTNGGNPDLKPETAKIYTLGLVYQPRYLPDLSVTLDYYSVAIDKAIATIGESTILAGCYSGRNPEFCPLIERGGSKQPDHQHRQPQPERRQGELGRHRPLAPLRPQDPERGPLRLRLGYRLAAEARPDAGRRHGGPRQGHLRPAGAGGRRRLEPRVEDERGHHLGPGRSGRRREHQVPERVQGVRRGLR